MALGSAARPPQWQQQIAPFLPPALARALHGLPAELAGRATELRVRLARPLVLVTAGRDWLLAADGSPVEDGSLALLPDRDIVEGFLQRITGGSLYAVEEQIRRGYLTLPGGHRVGLSGRAVLGKGGSVSTLTDVSGFNVRVAHHVHGVALPILPRLLTGPPQRRRLASVLVLAPPRGGKTTLLRDLARLASNGVPEWHLPPAQVVVVDERSEIAGCHKGIPQHDLGPRTDVLDGCPKTEGILWAIRALSPGVLVTDEIGGTADVQALLSASRAGASIVASAHAEDLAGARRRLGLGELVEQGIFDKAVTLSLRHGPGTVERVDDLTAG